MLMSQMEIILASALVIADLAICFGIGWKLRGQSDSAEDYFIGGKKTGTILLFLTAWASFSGAGNFIGQAGRGAMQGISAYWLWLGEGFLGGIIMGYLLAPYLSKFKYFSMPHFISGYLFNEDPQIRRIGGVAACMSCVDTHLNCAAANIVADIIDPESKLDSAVSIRYARWATLIAGIVAILSGLFGSFIYALGTYGYTVCGGVLIPAFVIGLVCRDKKSKEFHSSMSVTAAKIGMGVGVIVAILFELIPSWKALFGGGVLPAVIVTSVGMIVANLFCKDK